MFPALAMPFEPDEQAEKERSSMVFIFRRRLNSIAPPGPSRVRLAGSGSCVIG